MTEKVSDRLNEITLFGTALFWQKAIEFFTKLLQNSFSHMQSRTLI